MAKRSLKAGSTSQTEYVFIQDSASTTGAGKTGLVYNSSGLKAYYVRPRGSATSITLATLTVTGSFSSGGFVEVDATNMPGVYRFDIPDAVFAAGVDHVVVMLSGATGMAQVALEYDLVLYDPYDAVRLGLSALPNAASGTAGAIITSGTGTAQLSVNAGIVSANTTQLAGQTVIATAAVTFPSSVSSLDYSTVFTTAMTQSYRSAGAAPSLAQALFEVIAHLGNSRISGTTKTIVKIDGSTTAKTYTLDSSSTPTAITETT